MTVKSVLKDYTQKSRIFLYPYLDVMRKSSVVPIQTYMSWDNQYNVKDMKLVCLYHVKNDLDYRSFEKYRLLGNKLFESFKYCDNGQGVYIFDLSKERQNWEHIVEGRYSKISESHKKRILGFFKTSPNLGYFESFLYPEKYFRLYSQLLNEKEQTLREVGELCSKPDFEKEKLVVEILNLDIVNKPA